MMTLGAHIGRGRWGPKHGITLPFHYNFNNAPNIIIPHPSLQNCMYIRCLEILAKCTNVIEYLATF